MKETQYTIVHAVDLLLLLYLKLQMPISTGSLVFFKQGLQSFNVEGMVFVDRLVGVNRERQPHHHRHIHILFGNGIKDGC